MNKNIKDEIDNCLVDNDDYFYRDNEMARCDLNNISHQVDPSYETDKQKKKR